MTMQMTTALIPAAKHTPERNMELIWKIHGLPDEVVTRSINYELSGAESPDEYREMLIDLLAKYWELGGDHQVATVYAGDDLPYYITGGLTNGDSPTDPFDLIAMLNEIIWDELLEYAKQDWTLTSAKEAAEAREEAKSYFLGVDDIIIPDNALVEKVDDGYWVEARVWVDADYSD